MAARLNATQLRRLARTMGDAEQVGPDVSGLTVSPPYGRYSHSPVAAKRAYGPHSRMTVVVLGPGESVIDANGEEVRV